MMGTYQQGFIKKHKGCGGIVRYVESLDPTHWRWDAECLACGEIVCEEDIEFENGHEIIQNSPIGLVPKFIRRDERFLEVCGAIVRYYDAGNKIPVEWVEEYNELIDSHINSTLDSK